MLASEAVKIKENFFKHKDVFDQIKKCAAEGKSQLTYSGNVDVDYLSSLGYSISNPRTSSQYNETYMTVTISW